MKEKDKEIIVFRFTTEPPPRPFSPKKKRKKKKGKITKIEIADVLLSAFTFQMLFL